jgi:hypothetical protein
MIPAEIKLEHLRDYMICLLIPELSYKNGFYARDLRRYSKEEYKQLDPSYKYQFHPRPPHLSMDHGFWVIMEGAKNIHELQIIYHGYGYRQNISFEWYLSIPDSEKREYHLRFGHISKVVK